MSENQQANQTAVAEQGEEEDAKITFRVILTSDPTQPFRVVSVPAEAPFTALLEFAAEEFGVGSSSLAATSKDGIGISVHGATCGSVCLKYGTEVRLIPRDRVGASL
jgi:ubiquitin-fold modifier 1